MPGHLDGSFRGRVLRKILFLGQAVHAAGIGDRELQLPLGPSVDVLAWILKQPDAEEPVGMRPLQLPTCFRRLFGAVTAGVLGPLVKPQLYCDQAAVACGH